MIFLNTKKQTVKIEGMMCDHCAHHVKTEIQKIDGVKSCDVSLKDGTAIVKSKDGVQNQKIKDAVLAAGYKVVDIQ